MEFRRPALGDYLKYYSYLNDEGLYDLYNQNPTIIGWTYLERRIGEQIAARPSFHATYLWTQSGANTTNAQPRYSLAFSNWYTYIHPKIKEKLQTEYPLFDDNSVVRFSFWPARGYVAGFLNNYANGGDTNTLPYGVYYARKNWIEVEWATSHPHNHNPWVNYPYAGAGTTYIANITSFSGEYYPRYLSSNGEIYVSTQVAVRAGQNILVNSQTNPSQNGVYRVTTGAWIKLSQPAYPSIVYVWGYYATTNYLSNYTVFTYVRGFDSSNSLVKFFLQTSDTTFSSNYQYWTYTQTSNGFAGYTQGGTWNSVSYPAGLGFYLYHTLNDALNNTNKIPYTAAQSDETLNSAPYGQLSIDENHIQHINDYHTEYYFSPIDYTYPSFALQKGIGCCYVHADIVSSDIPDNMSFTYMGQSVSLKRFSTYYPEVVTEAEAVAYATSHNRFFGMPPLRWTYYKELFGTIWYKEDMFKKAQVYASGTDNYNGIMELIPASAMFSGPNINLKNPSNDFISTTGNFQTDTVFRSPTGQQDTWTYRDVGGRTAFFWAEDLNTIRVAILYTLFSTYYTPPNNTYTTDHEIVFAGGSFTYYYTGPNAFYRAAWATFKNANPNSSSRQATFNIVQLSTENGNPVYYSGETDDSWHFQRDFLATLPTSITVNRGGEFTLPEQLRLNMPNSFFANQYVDIDTAALVKNTTKIVQDPISVGNINVVLTLDKTDGIYYSEVMTLGPIKGAFKIKTNAYQLNTGNWVADHSITKDPITYSGYGSNYIPSSAFKSWNLGGYDNQFNINHSGFWYNNNDSFKILGSIRLIATTYQYFTTYDFNYGPEITPKWYVANDALGGYPTGLSQGTVWMDTRVPLNKNTAAGAHLGEGYSGWCAVMFSEWQDLRQPATNDGMSNNTIGPPMIINSYGALPQNGYSNNTAESYTLGGPLYRPDTDFYKRNHYFVQSNDSNCWLSSLSV